MLVEAERRRGTWSEVGLIKDLREEFGKQEFQSVLTRARSRRAMVAID